MSAGAETLPDAVADALAADPEAPLSLAGELLGVDTTNPPGHTRDLVAFVETFLRDRGVATDRVTVDPAKPNLLATLPGDGEPTLCLLGHADTVPFDAEEWAHDPLGERDGDRLYGRGATDMKGPLAAMLVALAAYADTATRPPVDLAFVLVSDEEVGGDAGLPAVLERGLDVDVCVIGETTCEGAHHSVTVADRGSIWLTLQATGVAAHGSRPPLGENAVDRLYAAVDHLRESLTARQLDLDPTVAAVVEESVEFYAPQMGAEAARALFEHPSVNLGRLSGGEAVNAVPASASAELDVRLAAGVDTSAVLADVRDCVADHEGVSVADVSWSVGTAEDPESPFVDAVASTASAVTGERVFRRSATGGGDAKTLRNAGVPTVEFALGTDTAHGVDEFTTLAALRDNAAVYARLPGALAARVGGHGDR